MGEAMGINLIMVVCLYPFVLIMYALLKNDAAPKKDWYFGVKLTKEQQKAPEVEEVCNTYNKQMRNWFIVLMLIPIPMIFIPWFSVFMTFWLGWMMVSIFAFFIPMGVANTKLKELKMEKGWKEIKDIPVYVELKEAGNIRRVKWYHFLSQCLLSVVLFVVAMLYCPEGKEPVMGILQGSFAGISFLFWLAAIWMDKQKTQIISSDSDVNINYSRAKKNLWKNLWVTCAWVNVAYMICMLFALDKDGRFGAVFTVSTIVYIVSTFGLLLWLIRKLSSLDKKYQDKMDLDATEDEDHWIWGLIYYNPKDKHSMVEKRVGGMGTTVNMATPFGKGFVAVMILLLLQIPVLNVWILMLEFTPIQLSVEGNKVIAEHLREEYVIPMISIKEVELLTELPKMSLNHGTSMAELRQGSYLIKEEGKSCEVFLNPQNTVFIRVETSLGTYYIGGYDDEETREVYEMIKK